MVSGSSAVVSVGSGSDSDSGRSSSISIDGSSISSASAAARATRKSSSSAAAAAAAGAAKAEPEHSSSSGKSNKSSSSSKSGGSSESIINQARVVESGSREVASETRTAPLCSRRAIAPWSGGPSTRLGGSSTASPAASSRGHRMHLARRRHALDRVDGSRSVGVSSDQERETGRERER